MASQDFIPDFTLYDLVSLMDGLGSRAQRDGYVQQLEALNLSIEHDARRAIRTWLIPAYQATWAQTRPGKERLRTALRLVISRWGFLPLGPLLPGVDTCLRSLREPKEIYALRRQFYRWLWDELFHAPFKPLANTDALEERIDPDFVKLPGLSGRWKNPQYRKLGYWDSMLRGNAWREDWPPRAS